jgi:hypothetical protein
LVLKKELDYRLVSQGLQFGLLVKEQSREFG